MKTPRLLILTALVVVAGGTALAFDPVKGPPRTDVVFFESEKFTDVRDSSFGASEKARDATLGELRTYLVKQANLLLAPGQQLKITVTDVDLAGEFEPWRGPQWSDVRIVKDIYPPDIKLAFQLTDADGHVLKQGDRDLKDLGFMMQLTIDRNDPLRFEKALLDDWLREEFHGLKAK
jgi:hypothetical protein